MKGMPFSLRSDQRGGLEAAATAAKKKSDFCCEEIEGEPCSVLDRGRSPSPPTSSSTLSSSLGGGGGGGGVGSSDTAGVAALSDNGSQQQQRPDSKWPGEGGGGGGEKKDEWASELQPIAPSVLGGGGGLDEWEAMLSETAVAATGSPGQEQTFLHWIMGDVDDSKYGPPQAPPPSEFEAFAGLGDVTGFGGGFDSSVSMASAMSQPQVTAANQMGATVAVASRAPFGANQNPGTEFLPPVPSSSLPMYFQEPPVVIDEKPPPQPQHLFSSSGPGCGGGLLVSHHQLHPPPQGPPSFFLPPPPDAHLILRPPPKRHHSIPSSEFSPKVPGLLNPAAVPYNAQQQQAVAAAAIAQQQQALVDSLLRAAELVEAGNSFGAREILARLNHQLPASPIGLRPLLRSAFLFKEVLSLLANTPGAAPAPLSNPWDVVLKLSSYKAFSEVSPLIHFTNFTCTQALLEEVGGADRIHVVDFDIGVGGQWSSFMQELAHRRSQAIPFLKITAFVSPSAFHPLELHLTRENLSHFAAELNIPFEFAFVSIESVNPRELLAAYANEAVAVNLPVGSHYTQSFQTLLRLVKQLNPKIVVSIDQGCDRSDLPFTHHFLHSFQACMVLLDSVDAAGTNADVANKIERFLVQPRVENAVLGRHKAVEKMPPWRALFASVGFVPLQFSNFTETQAECLLKRVQVRGFHIEKRQASLFLYWQRGELGSISAWKC